MSRCPWCTTPVANDGDTCDFECYRAWYAWGAMMVNGLNDGLLVLQPDERAPNKMYMQPWYPGAAELDDYLDNMEDTQAKNRE